MDAKGLSVHLTIGGEDRNLGKELAINLDTLSEELAAQPSWYAYYASLLADATVNYDKAKAYFEQLRAEVASERRSLRKGTGIRLTEKQVESEVDADSRVIAARDKVLKAKRSMEYLKVAARSFEQRLQALISMSQLAKKQMDVDPTIRRDPSQPRNPSGLPTKKRDDYLQELRELRGKKHF